MPPVHHHHDEYQCQCTALEGDIWVNTYVHILQHSKVIPGNVYILVLKGEIWVDKCTYFRVKVIFGEAHIL